MKTKLFAAALLAAGLGMTGQAIAKDSLTLGIGLEPPHLDPTAGAAAAIDEVTYQNVFEGLTRIGPDGAVLPGLAKGWTVSDDGLTYSFTLRDGVKFHDGTAFDSADVLFSIDRAMAEDSTNAQKGLFEPIAKVEAPNAKTVTITLKRPTGHFLFNLGWGDVVMVAPESADTNKTKPVGTGPFSFDRWSKGSEIRLKRNDAYWGDAAKLAKVSFKVMPDAASSAAALMSGDIDVFPNFGAPELLEQFRADPRFEVVVGTTEGETILSMNNTNKALSDIRVRRAIAHAINRQAIIDGAMFGSGTPIGSHFAPHHPAYLDLTGMYPHDQAKAKALLAEAGYASGLKLRLTLPPPSYARRGGEVIAAQLAAVGIETEIIPVEWAQWLKQVFKTTDYDLTIVSHTEPFDIGIYARDSYYFNYKSDRFNKVYADLTEAVDPAKRKALIGEAQKVLAEDSVNGFLFELAQNGVWKKGIKGLWANRPIQANDVTAAYWE